MSLSTNFPASYPSLNLNFVETRSLDPRITFTRASTGTYYDGVTTAKAEQNLLTYSQQFDITSNWSTTGAGSSITPDSTTAPDGTTTADTLTEDLATGVHRVGSVGFAGSSGDITLSCYVKNNTGSRYFTIGVTSSTTAYCAVTFNLSTVAATQTLIATYTNASSSITSVGNGWYRCVLTVNVTAAVAVTIGLAQDATFVSGGRGSQSYTGDGTSSVYIWGAQLEQRSSVTSYTATTTQPVTNYIPVLLTAPANAARFDCDPVTEESLGLLLEEQRTNYLLNSGQIQSGGSALNASLTGNTNVVPDGTISATTITAAAGSAQHGVNNFVTTLPASTTFILSAYVKAGTHNYCYLSTSSSSNWSTGGSVGVNLQTGQVISGTGIVKSVGNGWYRISISGTSSATAAVSRGLWVFLAGADGSSVFTATGYETIFAWGVSIEAGSFITSYIPTAASSVTRAADSGSITGTNFSSWYNLGEGTFAVDYQLGYKLAAIRLVSVSDGTASNSMEFIAAYGTVPAATAGSYLYGAAYGITGGINTAGAGTINNVANALRRSIVAYKTNDAASVNNGGAVGSDTTAVIPVVNRLYFSDSLNSNSTLINGWIRKVVYYPTRLTDAQLQSLTI